MRAPLIAVISVGIAAAAPAVAISAKEPSGAKSRGPAAGAVTDLTKPPGAASITNTTTHDNRHARLVKRFLEARNRLNRLIAKRDGRRTPKAARTAKQAQWSDRALRHAIRVLRFMIHGYALLQAANAFQWENNPEESVAWMIRFVDAGLNAMGNSFTSG